MRKILKHSTLLGERVFSLEEEVYEGEWDEKKKPDLDVEVGQIQEEDGIGAD